MKTSGPVLHHYLQEISHSNQFTPNKNMASSKINKQIHVTRSVAGHMLQTYAKGWTSSRETCHEASSANWQKKHKLPCKVKPNSQRPPSRRPRRTPRDTRKLASWMFQTCVIGATSVPAHSERGAEAKSIYCSRQARLPHLNKVKKTTTQKLQATSQQPRVTQSHKDPSRQIQTVWV